MKLISNIKSNGTFQKFNEIWNNRRYNGLLKLGFWFAFFLIIAFIVRIPGNENSIISYTTQEILEKTKSYNIYYKIDKDDIIENINGSFSNDEMILYFLDQKYFVKQNSIYLVDEEETLNIIDNPFEIDFSKINVLNIYNLIKDKQSLYETKTDDKRTNVYKITSTELSNLIGYDIYMNEDIEITIETTNDTLISVMLDLTKYMNYNELKYKNYNLKVSFDSINQIGAFSYSELLGIGE